MYSSIELDAPPQKKNPEKLQTSLQIIILNYQREFIYFHVSIYKFIYYI